MNEIKELMNLISSKYFLYHESFGVGEIETYLDSRDHPEFDERWNSSFKVLSSRNMSIRISDQDKELVNKMREKVFIKVFDICNNSELAGYVTDDFELIAKAAALKVEDEFISFMAACYFAGKLPHK